MAGMIRTVLGDIAPPAGPALIHEHLQIDLSHNKGPETVLGPGDIDDIIHDLADARRHGPMPPLRRRPSVPRLPQAAGPLPRLLHRLDAAMRR